jgi:isopenicillin-N epimerase
MPVNTDDEVVDAVTARLTRQTRLLVIDHITSPTGLVLPVDRLVGAAHARGVPVLVDAAHAPGQVAVDLSAVDADFWTGNLHKWAFAPKTVAVLVVQPRHRTLIRPLIASHHYAEGLLPAFDWTGTFDPSPVLAAPAGLRFAAELGGWAALRAHNNALAEDAALLLADALGTERPVASGRHAAMALADLGVTLDDAGHLALEDALSDRHGLVVSVTGSGAGYRFLRVCGQAYVDLDDVHRLAAVLPAELDRVVGAPTPAR